MAEKLLNFDAPLDVPLLENVLRVVYQSANAEEVNKTFHFLFDFNPFKLKILIITESYGFQCIRKI